MKRCMGLAALAVLAGCDTKRSGEDTSTPVDTGTPATTDTTDTTGTTGTTVAGIEIAGAYVDEFGTSHTIDDTSWTQIYGASTPTVFAIESYDNDLDFAVAANDPADPFNPGLFSRFDWVDDGADLWYCQTTFSAASAEDAEATPRGDDTDPAAGGCGGFSWTLLTP
jgi:hypothetical protein